MKTLRALCVVFLSVICLSDALYASPPAATISGHVSDAPTGAPLPGVIVQLYDSNGTFVAAVVTSGSGDYGFDAVADGIYYVRTFADAAHENELFNNLLCGSSCTVTSGNAIVVAAGVASQAADFALEPRHTELITGPVKSEGGAPLSGVRVSAYDAARRQLVASAVSAADGTYAVAVPFNTGSFLLRTFNTQGFLDEVHQNEGCNPICDLSRGSAVSPSLLPPGGITFFLQPAGSINGRVTSSAGVALAGVVVSFYSQGGALLSSTVTKADGTYQSTGLPDGSYRARTFNTQGFLNEAFHDFLCADPVTPGCAPVTGTVIPVTAAAPVPDIDFTLEPGGQISGTIRDDHIGAIARCDGRHLQRRLHAGHVLGD